MHITRVPLRACAALRSTAASRLTNKPLCGRCSTICCAVQVVLAALELANALVANEPAIMEAMCLVGVVPVVARYATAAWAKPLRLQAALFVQTLCQISLATAQMLVACQVCG